MPGFCIKVSASRCFISISNRCDYQNIDTSIPKSAEMLVVVKHMQYFCKFSIGMSPKLIFTMIELLSLRPTKARKCLVLKALKSRYFLEFSNSRGFLVRYYHRKTCKVVCYINESNANCRNFLHSLINFLFVKHIMSSVCNNSREIKFSLLF